MSKKASLLAEQIGQATSRRGFLGKAVGIAAGAAAVLAGVLAQAAPREKQKMCCVYYSQDFGDVFWYRCVERNKCPVRHGAELWAEYPVSDCSQCY